jgi:hypothetical protein
MMRLPVDIAMSAEEDEEEVEGEVGGDERHLADVAEFEEVCDLV